MKGAELCLFLTLMWFGGILVGWGIHSTCPDITEQTRARETQWAKQLQEFRGRAFRAEQATAEAMIEAARLQDRLQPWDNGYFMLVEQGTPEWAAAMRAKGFVSNSVLAVEQGAVR